MRFSKVAPLFYSKSPFDFDPLFPERTVSGFFSWFQLLSTALRRSGYEVRINDYALAQNNPSMAIGVVGHAHILDHWKLPNPAVLGPSLYDHPSVHPHLLDDPRYRYYLVTAEWFQRLFIPYYGNRCVLWYAGIDTDFWGDTAQERKTTDILIYDKLKRKREHRLRSILSPVCRELRNRRLSYEIIRYGNYSHVQYQAQLARTRSMLFLCDYETQGMGYQECLASNVPILAWDPGYWDATDYEDHPVPATSVPYFSQQCGETFASMDAFPAKLDYFISHLDDYRPRDYVRQHLSMEASASIYMNYLERCGP